ncbi:FecR family protein [Pedobacter nyackensis]|uniref:FecR family protein n=1 Tax=Pedobacter nyackensis TaxID=475255 RepID=A0A1W2AM40_9SPHI|nr:FecR family protein [Pedobacter nyackensis]SMC61755.1 FecR family protein [Pedobacter nyackensis]
MQEKEIKDLLRKYLSGNCTEEERALLESSYLQHEAHDLPELSDLQFSEIEHSFIKIPKKTDYRIWGTWAAAAAVLLMVSFGVYFYQSYNSGYSFKTQLIGKDIAAGKNKAFLTLSDGSKVELSNNQTGIIIANDNMMYTDSTVINTQAAISSATTPQSKENYKQFSLTTPRGGQYQIKLPDGTKVWLNSASSISYSTVLINKLVHRKVTLDGEAYFEVKKDAKQPFIVVSNDQEVEVLGTHFNINAYADEENVKTTLLEGSLRVKASAPNSVILIPNQQSISSDHSNTLEVKNVNPSTVLSWKNGEFSFENETLESIMKQVSRWYDVEIAYENEGLKKELFGGSISRFSEVSKVLKMLELTGHIHFIINEKERRITVMK